MKFKKGCIIYPCWQFEFFKYAADKVWLGLFGYEATLTSAMDRNHSDHSLHYQGMAWDLRIWNASQDDLIIACAGLRDILSVEFDVVQESDHIHVEFDPK